MHKLFFYSRHKKFYSTGVFALQKLRAEHPISDHNLFFWSNTSEFKKTEVQKRNKEDPESVTFLLQGQITSKSWKLSQQLC